MKNYFISFFHMIIKIFGYPISSIFDYDGIILNRFGRIADTSTAWGV